MKRVAVLGGSGFIGKNLVKNILRDGRYCVTSFDYHLESSCDKSQSLCYIKGDFYNTDDIKKIVEDNDVIVHAICSINPGNSNERYMFAYSHDLLKTVELCEMCSRMGKRLIFISSGGTVYGLQTKMPIVEETLSYPVNHYGNLKLCIENTLRTFSKQQGADIMIARIANVYGPGQDFKKGVGFIDAVLKSGLTGNTVCIYGDGSVVRDYVYIDDACKMLISLFQYSGNYDTFNIATGEGNSQLDILEIVSRYIPDMKKDFVEERSVDVKKIILDNSRIKSIYKDEILSVSQGVESYIDYLKRERKLG